MAKRHTHTRKRKNTSEGWIGAELQTKTTVDATLNRNIRFKVSSDKLNIKHLMSGQS